MSKVSPPLFSFFFFFFSDEFRIRAFIASSREFHEFANALLPYLGGERFVSNRAREQPPFLSFFFFLCFPCDKNFRPSERESRIRAESNQPWSFLQKRGEIISNNNVGSCVYDKKWRRVWRWKVLSNVSITSNSREMWFSSFERKRGFSFFFSRYRWEKILGKKIVLIKKYSYNIHQFSKVEFDHLSFFFFLEEEISFEPKRKKKKENKILRKVERVRRVNDSFRSHPRLVIALARAAASGGQKRGMEGKKKETGLLVRRWIIYSGWGGGDG